MKKIIILILFLLTISCEDKKYDNYSNLTDLEKRVIEKMPDEKKASVLRNLMEDRYEVTYNNAIRSYYYYNTAPCGSGSSAGAVAAGVVSGAVINKMIK